MKFLEATPRKFEAKKRPTGSIERRMDFDYMDGHGTFYQLQKEYLPDEKTLFGGRYGDRMSLVLYNKHTDQLDEVVFNLEGYSKIGNNCIAIDGIIADIKDVYRIKIEYYISRPLDTYILVYASAPYYYGCMSRLQ